jgi:hypothetical protein
MDTKGMGFTPPPPPRPASSCARRGLPAARNDAVPHVRRSWDLSRLTSSAAHWRASGIFPASLNARAFAKAWLSADRSAADSFPGRALWALRSAVDLLRIGTDPIVPVSAGSKFRLSKMGSQYLSVPSSSLARCRGCWKRSRSTSPPRDPRRRGVSASGRI